MNKYVQLAKRAIENYLEKGEFIEPPQDLPEEMTKERAGVFVTLEKGKELRGCIGTYLPTQKNIAKEIIQNAVSAATGDYRFSPVAREELSSLTYTVSVLEKPEKIKDVSQLNPKEYGILVKALTFPPKSALLLPNLQGIKKAQEQFSIVCQKGGINPEKESVIIYRFKIKKFISKENG